MKYEPALESGILVRRYKRFLTDVRLPAGDIITMHCPNTGSMKNCGEPGDEVWYSTSTNAKRKYANTWELTRTARGDFIGINSARANDLVKEALACGLIAELAGYSEVTSEVRYGVENSRVDFFLEGHASSRPCYVEVKSVTLLEAPVSRGVGYFPDAVSARASKHVRELTEAVQEGYRAVMFYCVQHSGIREVRPAQHIDEGYAGAIREAVKAGVEVIAYKVRMSPRSLTVKRPLPVIVGE